MIGYVTVGTNNLDQAAQFYDQLFDIICVKRLWATEEMIAWGPSRHECSFCITYPYDKERAYFGNGTMIALKVESSEQVKRVHSKALELGALDEGGPGPRGDHGFYGAYFRDLDGNKLNAYVPST